MSFLGLDDKERTTVSGISQPSEMQTAEQRAVIQQAENTLFLSVISVFFCCIGGFLASYFAYQGRKDAKAGNIIPDYALGSFARESSPIGASKRLSEPERTKTLFHYFGHWSNFKKPESFGALERISIRAYWRRFAGKTPKCVIRDNWCSVQY